ncbi:hypothetical protein DFS34DRAFT_644927 [Phlyctochytrium arcticum]|nr:hypothetical protein DFS34DRAFT_644927 [Phlyctochytrium arcticum]
MMMADDTAVYEEIPNHAECEIDVHDWFPAEAAPDEFIVVSLSVLSVSDRTRFSVAFGPDIACYVEYSRADEYSLQLVVQVPCPIVPPQSPVPLWLVMQREFSDSFVYTGLLGYFQYKIEPELQLANADSGPRESAVKGMAKSQLRTCRPKTQSRIRSLKTRNAPSNLWVQLGSNLDSLADTREWHVHVDPQLQDQRRLVKAVVIPSAEGQLRCSFQVISIRDVLPTDAVVSAILWREQATCFITSVDCIYLLEHIAGRSVEEKNRVRRNLEALKPLTICKAKKDTAAFYKLIMEFPKPRPRNIAKDVKVFPWEVLRSALIKILAKANLVNRF